MVPEGQRDGIDAATLHGWLAARSIARGLPAPVLDHGGWRVDTNAPDEACRHVFNRPSPGLRSLGATIERARVFLKLCDDAATLRATLPSRWSVTDSGFVMTGNPRTEPHLPAGYRLDRHARGNAITIRIVDIGDQTIAASGHGASAFGVFAYDRIATDPLHCRKGLASAVMAALGTAARSDTAHLLVATPIGRKLYESIGWRVLAPYSTAFIPLG